MSCGTTWSTKYGPSGPLVLGIPPVQSVSSMEVDCSKYIQRCKELENLIEALWDTAMIPDDLHIRIMSALNRSNSN